MDDETATDFGWDLTPEEVARIWTQAESSAARVVELRQIPQDWPVPTQVEAPPKLPPSPPPLDAGDIEKVRQIARRYIEIPADTPNPLEEGAVIEDPGHP